jgi:hypothetical protein
MTINQRTAAKAPTKMTKVQRVDDANVSKRRYRQVVSTRTRCKVFVVALQQELLYGGTQTSSIVQKPDQKPFYRHTPNSSKSTKSTLRVRLTSKMFLKMLLSFCTFESTKPGNKSKLFPGLRSGFCTLESTMKYNFDPDKMHPYATLAFFLMLMDRE